MSKPPEPIDYARPQRIAAAADARYLIATATCFVIGWGTGFLAGLLSFDSFDDSFAPWIFSVTIVFGSAIGAVLTVVVIAIMLVRGWRRG